ncbi:Synaptotagmin-12 [Bulinus truncatus]|nr:Synaptotagmin-12 [Bulinus truncatus]
MRIWFNLRDIDEKPTEYGDILFSLSYLPTAERLTVVIVKARSLRWKDGKDYGRSFCQSLPSAEWEKDQQKENHGKKGREESTLQRGDDIFCPLCSFTDCSTANNCCRIPIR